MLTAGVFYGLPLYPYFLALCYAVSGGSVVAVKVVQIALGLLTVVLTYATGTRLADSTVGLVAAALAAVYGPLVFHESMLIPEAIGVPLYAAGFYSCCLFLDAPSVRRAVLAGALLGLACLTKAGVLPFAVLFVAVLLLRPTLAATRPPAAALAAFAVAFVAVLAPVTLHNRIVGGDTVLLTSHAGLNFYIGNNPDADGTFRAPAGTGIGLEEQIADSRAVAEAAAGRALRPSEVSAYWSGRGTRLHPRPATALRGALGTEAAARVRCARASGSAGLPGGGSVQPVDAAAAGRSFARARTARRRGPSARRCRCDIAGASSSGSDATSRASSTFFVNARYRLPLLSVLFVLAAVAVADARRVRPRARLAAASPAGLVVVAAAVWITRLALVPTDPARDLRERRQSPAGGQRLRAGPRPLPRGAGARLRRTRRRISGWGSCSPSVGRGDEVGAILRSARSRRAPTRSPTTTSERGTSSGATSRQAEQCYRRAVELKPQFAQAHDNLGIIYARQGDTARAIDVVPDGAAVRSGELCGGDEPGPRARAGRPHRGRTPRVAGGRRARPVVRRREAGARTVLIHDRPPRRAFASGPKAARMRRANTVEGEDDGHSRSTLARDRSSRSRRGALSQLRAERHHLARAARRARRPEAGAAPHPLRDVPEPAPDGGGAAAQVGRRSSARCSASTTRTATWRRTRRWCAWRRTSRCATRWCTARATSARSTATARPPCATPRRG